MTEFILTGKVPSKKNRYEIGNGHFYQDDITTGWYESAGYEILLQSKKQDVKQYSIPIMLLVTFFGDNRSDVDNMSSSIMDLLQKQGIIKNDSLVHKLIAEKVVSKQYKTIIKIIKYPNEIRN